MSHVYEARIRTPTITYTHRICDALPWIEEVANANHKTYYHVTLLGRRCETKKNTIEHMGREQSDFATH